MQIDRYRRRLSEYLRSKGVDTSKNPTSCPNTAAHKNGDSNPSFSIKEKSNGDSCRCFTCNIGGGIYDMIGWFEGISDFAGQYKFAQDFFGDPVYTPPASKTKKRSDFKYNLEQMKILEAYLRKNPASEKMIRKFLADRANYSTGGGTHSGDAGAVSDYPENTIPFFVENLFYWPGLDIVLKDISRDALFNCGIPLVGQNGSQSTWMRSGVVMKLGQGYKLHFYEKKYCDGCGNSKKYREAVTRAEAEPEKLLECKKYGTKGFCHKCEKRNSKAGHAFPMPGQIDKTLPVVLVEGEMDALACAAAGIKNVFSTGGTSGLTSPYVQAHLLEAPEIILMFDADEKGRKASGIDILNASDDIKSVPKTILRGGYTGKIRLAELPLDNSEKDPDALVIAGKIGVMQKAIQEAKEYVPVAKPQKQKAPAFEFFADLSSKRLRCLLRKLERSKLDHDDVQPFVTACKNAFNYDDTGLLLREWGATVKELTNKNDTTPAFLLQVAHKYLSRYMQRQIEKELTPVEELLRRIKIQDVKIELDFEELEINENARNFVLYGGVRSAALMLADIFDGRIIYNAAKNDKRFYFFNGHIWQHEPDVTGVIYNTLLAVIKHFLRANKDSEADDEVKKKEKIRLMDVLRNIEKRTYRVEIQNEFASLKNEGVYHDSDKPDDALHFDGEATKETLTLSDGVLDFSGKELVFRAAKPEEYRSRILDYKIDDVKKGGPCEKIWKFMRGNFKNEDTLQTLMYELCIIMSRAFHKYGGFWIGGKNTGKSTTMQIMKAIFKHYICALDPNVIVPKGKTFVSGNGPTPYLARLPGHGAAFVSEPEDGAYLNAGLWKQLTGGDLVTARGLNEAPKDFRNTAHIIINTNHLPKFDRHDEAVIVRAVVIPFLVSHNANEEGTMRPEEFVEYLKPEFPAFIKLLAEYYVHFKHKLNGVIPISEESEAHKMGYIAEVETDLDRFVNDCFSFEPQSIEVIKKAYEQYNAYHEFDDTSSKRNDALSQHKFTRMIMKNYKDKITEQVRRVVIDGVSKPARCFVGLKLRTLEEVADRSIANSKASGDIFNAVNNQPEPDEGKPF